MKKLLLLVLAIVLSACAGVANAGEPKSEVEQAREKWQAANISHYRFNVHISCFCVFVENMPLVVEVKDGEVVSLEFATGNEIDPQLLPLFERYVTIDRLFDGLESGFDFEGSMDPGVEKFFRNFGGMRELYLVLRKNESLLWKLKERLV